MTIKTGLNQAIDLPGGIVSSPDLNGSLVRGLESGRMILVGFAPSITQIKHITLCSQFICCIPGQIEGMGDATEDISPAIDRFPAPPVRLHLIITSQQDNTQFIVPCISTPFFTLLHQTRLKIEVLPTCILFKNALVDNASCY